MLGRPLDFDWTQARAFLATAEAGSFSGGARRLGLTQPTLSRQVAALEADLGVTLFERIGNALQLTETGVDLLQHVRQMSDSADRLLLVASGRTEEVAGPVTITATDLVAMYLLPPALAKIRRRAPGISIEILASTTVQDLRRREADISIRHMRPTEPELIGRSLGDATAHLYGQSGYLDRIGRPRTLEDIVNKAEFLHFGFQQLDELLAELKGIGLTVDETQCPLGSHTPALTWELARRGFGLSLMMAHVGQQTPEMEAVLPDQIAPTFPCWLVAHREVHTSKRIRIVFDILAEELSGRV